MVVERKRSLRREPPSPARALVRTADGVGNVQNPHRVVVRGLWLIAREGSNGLRQRDHGLSLLVLTGLVQCLGEQPIETVEFATQRAYEQQRVREHRIGMLVAGVVAALPL